MFAEIGCVFLRGSRSAILVLAKESVFLEVFKVIGCCVSDQVVIAYWISSGFLRRLDVALGLE